MTPGLKLSYYRQAFTQYADNGKKIGNLNGAPSITHAAAYHSWLPSVDVHYMLQPNWAGTCSSPRVTPSRRRASST